LNEDLVPGPPVASLAAGDTTIINAMDALLNHTWR
jgi:hypothetical protein